MEISLRRREIISKSSKVGKKMDRGTVSNWSSLNWICGALDDGDLNDGVGFIEWGL